MEPGSCAMGLCVLTSGKLQKMMQEGKQGGKPGKIMNYLDFNGDKHLETTYRKFSKYLYPGGNDD